MHKSALLLLAAFLALSLCNGAAAGDDHLAAADAPLETLIDQLGSPEYAEREAAAARLLSAGTAAETKLREALRAPDLEIRIRCDEILSRIRHSDLERKLADFISGADDNPLELPGWTKYREVAGDDRPARELFVEMFRQERDVLACMDRPQNERDAVLNGRVQQIQQEMYGPRQGRGSPEPASIATVLLVSSEQDLSRSIGGIQAYSLLTQTPVMNAIKSGPHSKQLARLLDGWVDVGIKGSNPYYVLMIAMQYDLKQPSLEVARKLIAPKQSPRAASSSMLSTAILAVGKYGGDEDLERLEPLLKNKTVCHTWNNGQMVIQIQIRDVALAVLLHLTRQDHQKYGFELLQRYERTLFHIYTCGFKDDEKREAAQQKWREWQAAHESDKADKSDNEDKSDNADQ